MLRILSFLSIAALAAAPAPVHAARCGDASWYGPGFEGNLTANGERFNSSRLTLASPSLPFGTMVRVTNPANGRSVIARSNDRGPFVPGRVLDLSRAAFAAIAIPSQGVVRVCYRLV
jgi:rare lipoprotein A